MKESLDFLLAGIPLRESGPGVFDAVSENMAETFRESLCPTKKEIRNNHRLKQRFSTPGKTSLDVESLVRRPRTAEEKKTILPKRSN